MMSSLSVLVAIGPAPCRPRDGPLAVEVDARSDVWSLGVVLYEVFVRSRVEAHPSEKHEYANVPTDPVTALCPASTPAARGRLPVVKPIPIEAHVDNIAPAPAAQQPRPKVTPAHTSPSVVAVPALFED